MRRAHLVVLLLLAAAAVAHAQDAPAVVGVHLASVHTSPGWNNANAGVYARWRGGFTAGAFRNSEYRNSAYAGWTFSDSRDRFALTVGLVTGYSLAAVCPLVVPSVRLPLNERSSARLSLVVGAKATALHLSLERRF